MPLPQGVKGEAVVFHLKPLITPGGEVLSTFPMGKMINEANLLRIEKDFNSFSENQLNYAYNSQHVLYEILHPYR